MILKEFYFDVAASQAVLDDVVKYLEKFPRVEEGGLLLGSRVWDKTQTKLKVVARAFIPIKSAPGKWNLSKKDLKEFDIPPSDVGYLPDPKEVLALRQRIFPLNPKSSIKEIGFVHNHMQYPANPSAWDRKHVTPEFGYVLPIYSNKEKHLKVWFVSQILENKKWKSRTYDSLAPVELVATL